ncbi:FAD-dependent oxidoreductase, partial [Bacillus sp. SIMBA_008]
VESKLKLTTVYKGTKVKQIEKTDGGYGLQLDSGQTLFADSAIVTTPHQSIYSMFPKEAGLEYLHDMTSTSVATVALGFKEEDVHNEYDG